MGRAIGGLLLALLGSRVLLAQNPVPLDPAGRSISVDVFAGQHLLDLNHGGFAEFVSPSVSIGQPLSRRLEGFVNLQPALLVFQPVTQPPTADRETVWAAVLDVGLRWYPAPASWKWTPFLDAMAGVLGASHRVPAKGTNFNFNVQSGAGLLLPLGDRWHPYVAVHWYHISNGNLGNRNPSWDFWSIGVGGRLGFRP